MSARTCGHLAQQLVVDGVTYEIFCGVSPAKEYTNGWYCALHTPSVVLHGVVAPAPDPAMTATALAAKPPQRYIERTYGLPAEPAEVDVRKIRVLKAHKDAVLETMQDAAALITTGGMETFAEVMAGAVLSASDSKVDWVVGVRVPGEGPMIFGPYASADAAQKAIDGGHIPAYVEGTQAWVFPMLPAPRATKKKAPAKKTTA